MITISLTTAVLIYLTLGLCFLLGIWLKDNYQRSRRTPPSPLFQLYICEYCQFPYLDESEVTVTRCPRCNSMNKNNQYRSKKV